jgi:hypothetical protein
MASSQLPEMPKLPRSPKVNVKTCDEIGEAAFQFGFFGNSGDWGNPLRAISRCFE